MKTKAKAAARDSAHERCLTAAAAIRRQDFDGARLAYLEALRLGTRNPDAYNNLAAFALSRGESDQALDFLERGVARATPAEALREQLVRMLDRRAAAHAAAKRWSAALVDVERLTELRPDDAMLMCRMAGTCLNAGSHEKGISFAERAIALAPDRPNGHAALATLLSELGRVQEAFTAFEQALARDPDNVAANNNLGLLAAKLGRHGTAVSFFVKALEQGPSAPVLVNLAATLGTQGEVADAVRAHRGALALEPKLPALRSGLLLTLNFDASATPELLAAEHRAFGACVAEVLGPPRRLAIPDPRPDRRLRVAYFSPDFRRHSVAYFIEPVLEAHDRRVVELWAYALTPGGDDVTERLRRQCAGWRDVWAASDEEIAHQMQADGIDVVVDLAGHTAGNRLLALARRAAPVQATYLGYPNSSGLPAMDVRITDALADPVGVADDLYTERLARIEGGFLCYRPPEDAPEIAPLPAAAGAAFTFGSFNTLSKLNDGVVDAWARILAGAPGSRLLLKAKSLQDPRVRRRLMATFEKRGIAEDRLVLGGHTLGTAEHLALYGQVDLGLDSFPYNGTTTTCEALWMGVPVVAIEGAVHAARVGVSLLSSVGLTELLAPDVDAYVATAIAWTTRLPELAALRASLRDRMRASPLMDARRVAAGLEAAYRDAWRAAVR